MDELGDNGKPKGGGATYVRNRLLIPSYRLMAGPRVVSERGDYFFTHVTKRPRLIKLK